jgi:hypothetical protein
LAKLLFSVSDSGVGKISSSNRQVGVVLPVEVVSAIDSRRDGQTMTRSKYVGLIVAKWYADGCPPVNEADRAIKVMRAAAKPVKKPDSKAA